MGVMLWAIKGIFDLGLQWLTNNSIVQIIFGLHQYLIYEFWPKIVLKLSTICLFVKKYRFSSNIDALSLQSWCVQLLILPFFAE